MVVEGQALSVPLLVLRAKCREVALAAHMASKALSAFRRVIGRAGGRGHEHEHTPARPRAYPTINRPDHSHSHGHGHGMPPLLSAGQRLWSDPVARVVLALVMLAGSVGGFTLTAYGDQYVNGGVAWGPEIPYVEHADVNPLGVNVFLEKEVDFAKVERTLQMVRDGGFKWVRQTFPWNDIEIHGKGDFVDKRNPGQPVDAWAKYDRIVEACERYGLRIIARLDAPPVWARRPGDDVQTYHKGPPANYRDYGDFVEAVARRYRGKIKHFQIWNEPNLHGEWGGHPVNPAEYTELLKEAYTRIKAVDPQAVVITAALAPTAEQTVANLNDVLFLEGMYRAGAGRYFDVLSTMLYGLGQPPDSRRTDLKYLNFSRPILLRRVMESNGDGNKPIWISEYAWISLPPDFAGDPSKNIWGRSVDERTQARWLVEGYQRALAEWPWMGVMCVWYFREPDPRPEEPANYFAIVRPDFSPRPAYEAIREYSRLFPLAGVGQHRAGGAGVSVEAAGSGHYTATIRFLGNRLDATPAPTVEEATVRIDDGPEQAVPVAASGDGPGVRVTLAAGLPYEPHTAVLTLRARGEPAEGSVVSFTVLRDKPLWNALGFPVAYALFGLLALAGASLGAAGAGRWVGAMLNLPMGAYDEAMRERARNGAAVVGMALLVLLYYVTDDRGLMLAALAGWWVLALLKPQVGLAAVAFTIPFFWHPKQMGQQRFPLAETLLLLVFAAVLTRYALSYFLPGVAARLNIGVGESRDAGEGAREAERAGEEQADLPGPDGARGWSGDAAACYEGASPAKSSRDDELIPAQWPPKPRTPKAGTMVREARHTGRTSEMWVPVMRERAEQQASAGVDADADAGAKAEARSRRGSLSGRAMEYAQRLRAWYRQDVFGAPAVALLLVGTLSMLTLADPSFARDSARAYRWVIVEPVLFYLLLTDVIASRRGLMRVADFFVAGAVLVSLIGLWQFVQDTNTLDVQGVSRVFGVYQHPNNLALYLGRVVPLVGCLALFLPWGWRKALYTVVVLPLGGALLLTFSRGAWLGVAAGVLVAVSLGLRWRARGKGASRDAGRDDESRRAWAAAVVGAIVVIALVAFAVASMPQLRERVLNVGSGSLRVLHWQSAARMIADHPLFGIGPDQFLNQFQARQVIADPEQCEHRYREHPRGYIVDPAQCKEFYTAHPHNLVLDYWLSLGIMGLIVLVWVLWRYFRQALYIVRRATSGMRPDLVGRALALGLTGSMVDFVVHGMVDNSYFLMDLAMIFWMSCGLVQLIGQTSPDREVGA